MHIHKATSTNFNNISQGIKIICAVTTNEDVICPDKAYNLIYKKLNIGNNSVFYNMSRNIHM